MDAYGEARMRQAASHESSTTVETITGLSVFGNPTRFTGKQLSKHVKSDVTTESNLMIHRIYNSCMVSPDYIDSLKAQIAGGLRGAMGLLHPTQVYIVKAFAHIGELKETKGVKYAGYRTPMIAKDHYRTASACIDPFINTMMAGMVHPVRSHKNVANSTGSESFRINRPNAYVMAVRISIRP